MNENIKCLCGRDYDKIEFKKHYKECEMFLDKFNDFDVKISMLLKSYCYNKEDLLYIKFLFKRYIKLIDYKIKSFQNDDIMMLEINNIINDNSFENQKKNISRNNSKDKLNNNNNNDINIQKKLYNIPINAISNKNINNNDSYMNSVLQSILYLDCIRDWQNQINNKASLKNMNSLTKEFNQLLYNLYNQQPMDTTKIKLIYEEKTNSLLNKKNKTNPYNFLNNFLELLHFENCQPLNKNFNINQIKLKNIEMMRNDNYMYNLYLSFIKQTQNSIISQKFFNTIKYIIKCQNCSDIYYYNFKIIFEFEIDKYKFFRNQVYPLQKDMNLNLDECFKCYMEEKSSKCITCGESHAHDKINIFSSNKVLIIYFKRNKHTYKCDINFKNKISIFDIIYPDKEINIYQNLDYILKACISCDKEENYFSDIYINNKWYRFMNDKVKMLENKEKEIIEYEPQILIYELEEYKNINDINQSYNYINSIFNKPNNNIINFNPSFQLQQKQLQTFIIYNQMRQNITYIHKLLNDNLNYNDYLSINPFYITIIFLIISDNQGNDKILIKATLDDKIEDIINKFFDIIKKPKNYIKSFLFDLENININSNRKLRDYNINQNSIVLAIKNNKNEDKV